mgnify:CR=1 FL=1
MRDKNPKSPKASLAILVALSGIGWINSFLTLRHRQSLISEGLDKPSFCNVSSTVNCDTVAFSDYSAFLGFPTAAWAMLFYAVIAVLAVWAYFSAQDGEDEKVAAGSKLVFGIILAGLVPTLALAGVSAFVLKSLCLMCLGTYIVNLALVFFAWRLSSSTAKIGYGKSLKLTPQSLWIVGLVAIGLHALMPRMTDPAGADRLDDNMLKSIVASHFASTPKTLRSDESPFLGPADAPVTIVEFSDFQCPFCARAAMTLPEVIKGYGKQVRLVFKHYPLDPSCNSGIKGGGHGKACQAAKASRCVFKAKGSEAFFRFADKLFHKQSQIGDALIFEAAAAEGVDKDALNACVSDVATHQAVTDEIAEGNAAGVQATPTLYINGRKTEYGTVPRILKELIKGHLEKAR